jgi:hypothetical protein
MLCCCFVLIVVVVVVIVDVIKKLLPIFLVPRWSPWPLQGQLDSERGGRIGNLLSTSGREGWSPGRPLGSSTARCGSAHGQRYVHTCYSWLAILSPKDGIFLKKPGKLNYVRMTRLGDFFPFWLHNVYFVNLSRNFAKPSLHEHQKMDPCFIKWALRNFPIIFLIGWVHFRCSCKSTLRIWCNWKWLEAVSDQLYSFKATWRLIKYQSQLL